MNVYINTLDNLDEMNMFLETQNVTKKGSQHRKYLQIYKEFKTYHKIKAQDQIILLVNFMIRTNINPYQSFPKIIEKEGILPNLFCKANFAWYQSQTSTVKKNTIRSCCCCCC